VPSDNLDHEISAENVDDKAKKLGAGRNRELSLGDHCILGGIRNAHSPARKIVSDESELE